MFGVLLGKDGKKKKKQVVLVCYLLMLFFCLFHFFIFIFLVKVVCTENYADAVSCEYLVLCVTSCISTPGARS